MRSRSTPAKAKTRRESTPMKKVCVDLLQTHQTESARGQPLLTEAGVAYLTTKLPESSRNGATKTQRPQFALLRNQKARPRWDKNGRRLWLGNELLKEFRKPARHQILLLAAFQEQKWAKRIDDPLPRERGEQARDAMRRLRETIKNLNRGLPPGTIRFLGDGTGCGLSWEYVASRRKIR